MTQLRSLIYFALAGAVAGTLATQAQARTLHDEDVCPTGQHENPITAICEGPFTGSFMFVEPGYDGGNGYTHWYRHGHMRRHY